MNIHTLSGNGDIKFATNSKKHDLCTIFYLTIYKPMNYNFLLKLFLSIVFTLGITPKAFSQGWEENYGGVMLQGFYWDSFEDTKWTNLTSQADELSAYFDLIWVPNSGASGYYSMGYNPQYWFMHESSFGTESELRSMINTFKAKGTGFIADVVINHRNGVNGWYDFPVETDHNGKTWELGLWAICGNDEMAYADGQPTPTGANDEGENFDGCRDLDHTNTYVQDAIKAYLDFLLNDLGYTGFRYDMTKGYAAYYTGLYNEAAKPKFSVGEYWDGNYDNVTEWIDGTIRNNEIQSAAFDFPCKYAMNEAFTAGSSDFTKLAWWRSDINANQPAGLVHMDGFRRFAVTFVDNHDTYRDGSKFTNDAYVQAANAFILCSPGTPCVFLPHWKAYKDEIKKLIDIRKSVGVHNQSSVEVWEASTSVYAAKVYGTNGDLFIKVGYGDYSPTGYSSDEIVASGEGYCVWTKSAITSGEDKIVPPNDGNGISVYLKKESVPSTWTSVYYYGWDNDNERVTAAWPGAEVTKIVTINNVEYYKYTFDSSIESLNVVFSNGNGSQSADVTDITADTYYSISTTGSDGKHTVTPITAPTGTETSDPISVYLKKNSVPSTWGTVKYYAWDSDETTLLGAWPGTEVSTEIINGSEYYVYTFPETVTSLNVIFNDGTNQTVDIKGITETTYYSISNLTDNKYNVEEITLVPEGGISVYLKKSSVSSWSNVNYYAWDNSGNSLLGDWPGTQVKETVSIGGNDYYVYTFPADVTSLNIIFNNGTGQTDDIKNITQTSYFSINSDFSYNQYESTISVYLDKQSASAWSKVNYYAWDNNDNPLLGTWPGTQVKETIIGEDGKEYYCYTFDPSIESLNIIFNDGTNQTSDIKGITKSVFYSLNSTSGSAISVSTVSTDIATGVEEIAIKDSEATIEYYNLQGIKVENPTSGLYIKKQGTKATKVVF